MLTQSKLLLHTCCAPCSSAAVRMLKSYKISFFSYNPNIYPKEEYMMRLNETRKISKIEGIDLIEGEYDHKLWLKSAKPLKDEPERGKRCNFCYYDRLKKTAEIAKKRGFDYFATTLTLSPHKNADCINSIGKDIEKEIGVKYYESNFKKKDGYNYSIRYSREHGLKRQDYCGCEFSRRHKD